jgi:mitochondrial fission protein ELM1
MLLQQDLDQMINKVWVLADNRPGNVNQLIGIAEQLGFPYEVKKIRYNVLAKLPNFLRGGSLIGMDKRVSDKLEGPYPDIVLSAGRRTAPIAKYLKKKNPITSIVQIMSPEASLKDFDLIVLPEHDNCEARDNIITTIGAPNKITLNIINEAAKQWEAEFSYLEKPYIALLIGGASKKGSLTEEHMLSLAKYASAIAYMNNASLLITTSRRTDPKLIAILTKRLTVPYYLYSGQVPQNPFLAYLGLSDSIIVTGDSMSMCSESCSTGKPVYIFSPEGLASKKHRKLHQSLYKLNLAAPLEFPLIEKLWNPIPLNEAAKVADKIKKLLNLK